MSDTVTEYDYDVIVIGSGFGGSVTALRLTEKGYRVGVLESGRRWNPEDFPKSNWNIRKSLWMPRLGLTGPQRISVLGKCAARRTFFNRMNSSGCAATMSSSRSTRNAPPSTIGRPWVNSAFCPLP